MTDSETEEMGNLTKETNSAEISDNTEEKTVTPPTDNEQEEQPDEQQSEDEKDEKDKLIEELQNKLADEEEKYKRLDAEYYNYRNRSIKEKQEAASEAAAKTVAEILSVIDNFERALTVETADESYKKGVEMIYAQFCDILKKLGVEEIDAMGKPFDPNFHHAVNQTEDENFGENTVCAVFQKGYKMDKKVIRPAMVSVANP